MAIDTSSLTKLITEFRALKAKDSITPESLGYILQRLADLFTSAGEFSTLDSLNKLIQNYVKAGSAIIELKQGEADRNHFYATISKLNLANGATSTSTSILVQQATTERAGVMRAQQVTDLNAAKKNITTLQGQLNNTEQTLDNMQQEVTDLSNSVKDLEQDIADATGASMQSISCFIKNNRLYILGASDLIKAGYVPYIFRSIRKRNPFRDNKVAEEDRKSKFCRPSKGWCAFGSIHSVKIDGMEVQFSTNSHKKLSCESAKFSADPKTFVQTNVNHDGILTVAWGRSIIKIGSDDSTYRMIRLRYGIGFGKPIYPGRSKITPANLVSTMAEFTIIFDPTEKQWVFSRP